MVCAAGSCLLRFIQGGCRCWQPRESRMLRREWPDANCCTAVDEMLLQAPGKQGFAIQAFKATT